MLIFDVLRCRSRCTQMLPPPGHAQDTVTRNYTWYP